MMYTLQVRKTPVNIDLLDEQLRSALGVAISGISYHGDMILLHFVSDPTNEQIIIAQTTIGTHDATQKTTRQQQQEDRKTQLQSKRQTYRNRIDTSQYQSEAPLIQELAKRIELLEMEIAELRNV